MTGEPQGGTLLDAIASGRMSLDDALTDYRPPTAGERAQTFVAIAGRAARDAYLSGTSAELRIIERGLALAGADKAANWMRGFADYVAPGGGFAEEVPLDLLPNVPEAAQNEPSAILRAITQYLPEGLGSTAGILALPGLKGVGGVAQRGALVGAWQQFVEAKAAGADDLTAWEAFAGGGLLGATDAIPIGRLLGRADEASGGALKRILWEGLVKSGAEEGIQETLQSIGENVLAGVLYDEDRELLENVLEQGQGGALTGMLLGAVTHAVAGRGRGRATAPQEGPGAEIAAPDAEASQGLQDVGGTTLREAPESVRRYVEARGGRAYVAEGKLRAPAVTRGRTIVLDAANPSEALVDHEVGGHLGALVTSEAERAALAAELEAVAPGLLERSRAEYSADAGAPADAEEGIARTFEDFSPVVRALRTNPESLVRVQSPGFWRGLVRAVARAVGRRDAGRDLVEAWRAVKGPESVDPETGRKVAEILGRYLDSMVGRTAPDRAPRGTEDVTAPVSEETDAVSGVSAPVSTASEAGTPDVPEAQSQENPTSLPSSLPGIPEPGPAPEPGIPTERPQFTKGQIRQRILDIADHAFWRQRGQQTRVGEIPWTASHPIFETRPTLASGKQVSLNDIVATAEKIRSGSSPSEKDILIGGWLAEEAEKSLMREQGFAAFAVARRPNLDAMRASIKAAPDAELDRIIASEGQSPDDAARRIYAIVERAIRTGDTKTLDELRKHLGGSDANYAVYRRAFPTSGTVNMPWDVRDNFLRWAQDSWRAPGRWRDAMAAAGRVTDQNDIILQEGLRRSQTLRVIQDETGAVVTPLRELLASGKVSLDDAGRYLLARAAPDRNRIVLERGGGPNGSGISDADAAKIVADAENGPEGQRYRDIASAFDRLTQRKLDLMEQYGLITPERHAELLAAEPRYAPQKTGEQVEVLYGESQRPQTGIARTRRREFRGATGRSTEADNPIVFATMDLMAAIERGKWNAMTGRAVLDLARATADPRVATVDVPAMQRTVVDGKIRDVPAREAPNEVVVKEGGVSHVVRFGKGWEPVAEAIKGVDGRSADLLLQALRPATRTIAGLSTRWNPAFWPVNAVRDAAGGGLNVTADLGPEAAATIVKSIPSAYKSLTTNDAWAERYAKAGGPTAFLDLARTFEEEAKRTIREIQRLQSPNAPWEMTRKYASKVADLFDKAGSVVENATRLAAFRYMVEVQGATDERAAQYAKELTTNFERRGANPWMSALYAFSNAGIQGGARVVQALRTPWGQRAAAALVAGSFLLSFLNRVTGGEDEDGVARWDKVPAWQRRSNAIFMVGDTKLMVPLPFVWNIFNALGTEIERAANGSQDAMESTGAIGSAIAGAINPLGGEADFIDTATPTLLDPLVQLERNRDYAGRRILPTKRSEQQPDSALVWDNTSPTATALAQGLNSMTGGDSGMPGLVDVSPASLEFLLKQYLGGVGGEGSRVLRIAEKFLRGEEVEASDVPLVRRFVGTMGLSEQRDFYKSRRRLIEAQELREKAGEPYDADLWRLRKRANRWDERIRELETAGRKATGEERARIRAQLRDVFLEATEAIEGARQ